MYYVLNKTTSVTNPVPEAIKLQTFRESPQCIQCNVFFSDILFKSNNAMSLLTHA